MARVLVYSVWLMCWSAVHGDEGGVHWSTLCGSCSGLQCAAHVLVYSVHVWLMFWFTVYGSCVGLRYTVHRQADIKFALLYTDHQTIMCCTQTIRQLCSVYRHRPSCAAHRPSDNYVVCTDTDHHVLHTDHQTIMYYCTQTIN